MQALESGVTESGVKYDIVKYTDAPGDKVRPRYLALPGSIELAINVLKLHFCTRFWCTS
jgi:hypothetical protein